MRKKFTWLFLLSLIIGLSACGKTAAATSQATHTPTVVKLAKSGVVSKDKMTQLVQAKRNFTFKGQTHGISYTWAYTAAQVKNPTKQKLGLKLTEKDIQAALKKTAGATNHISFKLAKFHLAGSPTLTITIPKHWHATAVTLVTAKPLTVQSKTAVQLKRTANKTRLTLKVTATNQTYHLIGTKHVATKTVKSAKATSHSQTTVAKKKSQTTATAKKAQKTTRKQATTAATTTASSATSSASTADTSDDSAAHATTSSSTTQSSQHAATQNQTTTSANATTKTTKSTATKTNTTPTVTISISCATAAAKLGDVKSSKQAYVPSDGWILKPTKVTLKSGESVYDVLKTVTAAHGIQMESRYTPMYGAYYIEGIHQLYEFDAGSLSGWMYAVDGWFPNYGASEYTDLKDGSVIKWVYTLNLGSDVAATQ